MHNHEIFYNKILRDFRGIAVFVCDGLLRRHSLSQNAFMHWFCTSVRLSVRLSVAN